MTKPMITEDFRVRWRIEYTHRLKLTKETHTMESPKTPKLALGAQEVVQGAKAGGRTSVSEKEPVTQRKQTVGPGAGGGLG